MTSPTDYPLTELVLRDWARTRAGLLVLLSNDTRKIDLHPDPQATSIGMSRGGGAPLANVPVDRATITWHCWGPATANASPAPSLRLATALMAEVNAINGQEWPGGHHGLHGEVIGMYYSPGAGDRPRHIVNSTIAVRKSGL